MLSGLAPDGGLYMPAAWPVIAATDQASFQRAKLSSVAGRILSAFAGDEVSEENLRDMAVRAYAAGEEAWKAKESKVGTEVPETWGDWKRRALNWETLTACTLAQSGADIVVLRHPETLGRVRQMLTGLMAPAAG